MWEYLICETKNALDGWLAPQTHKKSAACSSVEWLNACAMDRE